MSQPHFSPHGTKVTVRPYKDNTVSEGGIVLSLSSQPPATKGEIVSIGPKVCFPYDFSVGDVVLFRAHGGSVVEVDGEDLLVMEASYIYAVIK